MQRSEAPPARETTSSPANLIPQSQSQSQSKAQEATSSQRSSVTSSPASLRSLRSVETNGFMGSNTAIEATPALHDIDNLPPPAYSAAAPSDSGPTMTREINTEPAFSSRYGAAEVPNSRRTISPVMQETSRTRSGVADLESEPLLVRRTPPKRRGCCARCFGECCDGRCNTRCTLRWILGACLIVLVPCFIIARLLSGKSSQHGGHGGTVVYPDPFEGFIPPTECPIPVRFDNTTIVFNSLDKFTFREVMNENKPAKPKFTVAGRVSVQVAKFPQDAAVIAFVATGAETDEILKWVNYRKTHSVLELDTSHFGGLLSECVAINVVLSIKPGLSLDSLDLKTVNMNIDIHEGLKMTVRETNIGSFNGNVDSAEESLFDPRRIFIKSVAGDVRGDWPLLDILSIFSNAGDIYVKAFPKEASKEQPLPAEFVAETGAGDITVRFPSTGILPSRNYTTTVQSMAGDVYGHFIHGTFTNLTSASGNVIANVTPYAADGYNSTLETQAGAGDVGLVLRSPHKNSGQPMRSLTSLHRAFAGDIKVTFPPEWEGVVEASTAVGSVKVEGKNLTRVRERDHEYKGAKGKGQSLTSVFSFSGNVLFIAKDEN